MPRGHLKHQRGISRKAARGGASRGGGLRTNKEYRAEEPRERTHERYVAWSLGGVEQEHHHHQVYLDDGDSDSHPVAWTCSTCTFDNSNLDFLACEACGTERDESKDVIRYSDDLPKAEDDGDSQPTTKTCCPICCEEDVPLIRLMHNCQHEPACRACLRRLYVTDAQQGGVGSFPLQCYHPSCQKKGVRETQLVRHGLCETKAELTRHYRLTELSKGYRLQGKLGGATDQEPHVQTAYCPGCDQPRTFCSSPNRRALYRSVRCRECQLVYVFPEHQGLAHVLDNLGRDGMGMNDGWAPCPHCKILISKGDGCDHMQCQVCKTHFSWRKALEKKAAMASHTPMTTAATTAAEPAPPLQHNLPPVGEIFNEEGDY